MERVNHGANKVGRQAGGPGTPLKTGHQIRITGVVGGLENMASRCQRSKRDIHAPTAKRSVVGMLTDARSYIGSALGRVTGMARKHAISLLP